MSDLYCLKCKKYAYRNRHKCDILSLVPVTRRCRNLADRLYELCIEPLSVGHFTQLVNGSKDRYIINICVELKHSYQVWLLDNLPIKWKIYTETFSSDRTQLVIPVLAYYETYYYDGIKTVDNRVQEIIDGFFQFLDNSFDADGIKSVNMLMHD